LFTWQLHFLQLYYDFWFLFKSLSFLGLPQAGSTLAEDKLLESLETAYYCLLWCRNSSVKPLNGTENIDVNLGTQ